MSLTVICDNCYVVIFRRRINVISGGDFVKVAEFVDTSLSRGDVYEMGSWGGKPVAKNEREKVGCFPSQPNYRVIY